MTTLLWILACTPQDAPRPHSVGLVSAPILEEGTDVPLARRLQVALDVPARLTLVLRADDRELEVQFPDLASSFDVPILGLVPDTAYEVVLRGTTDQGRSTDLDILELQTDPLPDDFPEVDVLAHDPGRSEGGNWLLSIDCPGAGKWLAVYDMSDLSLVWLYSGPIAWGDARLTADSHLFGLFGGSGNGTGDPLDGGGPMPGDAIEMDLLGNVWNRWTHDEVGESAVHLPWSLNHEAYPLADGSFWSIGIQTTQVAAYPGSYGDPTPDRPAAIEDPLIVHVGAGGEVLSEWAISERLDPSRIGFNSLELEQAGYGWGHANGLIPDPAGGFVVSLRHQDVLAGLDEAGELTWLLGDPGGWGQPWSDFLLSPEPGLNWQYHQHGPAFDENGILWMMDNHTVSSTPYDLHPSQAGPSRLVGFEIDRSAQSVRQVAEWYPEDELQSAALGNASPLPNTGNFLVDFGITQAENGVPNSAQGWGDSAARVMEIELDEPEPIVDLRFRTDVAEGSGGVNVYRVVRIESLYEALATTERIR